MRRHEQVIIKSHDIHGKEALIGTFWTDDQDGNLVIDENNLPSDSEIAALLKYLLLGRKVELETGASFCDEE